MRPFLAMITPLTGGGGEHPDNSLPPMQGPVDPGYGIPARPPGRPSQPIYYPKPPGTPTHPIYNPAYPDNTLPGNQPYPDQGLPQPPPGIWGGGNVPMPTPPIYIPPDNTEPPLGIWGPTDPRPGYGLPGPQPHPEHPIVLPPDLPPTTPEGGPIDWKVAWTPVTGWVVVGVPAEGTLVPTPSKK